MNTSSVTQQLAKGHALQQQGRLLEAAETLRQLLLHEPRNGHALHLLGVTLGQMGRPQEAIDLIVAAISVQPTNPYMHANLGNALREAGQNAEALASYDRAVALQPDMAAAHRGRGLVLTRLGQTQQALASLTRALQLAPRDAAAHNDLGVALESLGRNQEALDQFVHATGLDPYHAEAHHNLGIVQMILGQHADALTSLERALSLQPRRAALLANRGRALRALGRDAEALSSYDAALALSPADASLHHSRGVILLGLQRYEEALGSFDRALAINANSAEVLNSRGAALGHLARPQEALAAFDRAVACRADYLEAHTNRANTLKGFGRFREALEDLDRALAIAPDHVPSLWSKSLLKLTLGAFAEGWPLYESRLQLQELQRYQRNLALPRWHGSEPLEHKSILVHAEQGLGDALQFCRYLPLLEARAQHVFFEVPATLGRLMRSLPMRVTLLVAGEPLPQADYHCPLLSLPLAFGTEAHTIPGGVPYLKADAAAIDEWRTRLLALPGFKVGVNWQGHAGTENQPWIRGRSFALDSMAPLARVPGVSLVSLQKGAAAVERAEVEFGAALAQLTDPMDTGPEALVETAALMCALDLVITSDTSVAHLAGALGVPVWVVLQSVPDWRWLLERGDSPWYPTARLFRQDENGDWSQVFSRVAQELATLAGRRW